MTDWLEQLDELNKLVGKEKGAACRQSHQLREHDRELIDAAKRVGALEIDNRSMREALGRRDLDRHEVDNLRALLRQAEWPDYEARCTSCKATRPYHATGCELAKALGRGQES